MDYPHTISVEQKTGVNTFAAAVTMSAYVSPLRPSVDEANYDMQLVNPHNIHAPLGTSRANVTALSLGSRVTWGGMVLYTRERPKTWEIGDDMDHLTVVADEAQYNG